MRSKIKFLLLFVTLNNCVFLPIDYHRGGAKTYGNKECWFHYGIGEDGMLNKYHKSLQQYCGISELGSSFEGIRYQKCNSCDEFMKGSGF